MGKFGLTAQMRNANERHSETTEELEEEQDLRVVSKYLPTAFLPPTETALLRATVYVILRGRGGCPQSQKIKIGITRLMIQCDR